MGVSDSRNKQAPAVQVEPTDSSEQSLDEQFVQLAQAKLDGRIDQETYEQLVSHVRQLQPAHNWDSTELVQYPRRPLKARIDFSILERTFIFACIVFLAFVVFGVIINAVGHSTQQPYTRSTVTSADLANLRVALDAFEIDNGRYPTPTEGLNALMRSPPSLMPSWRGPYVKSVPADPWGRPYLYTIPGRNHPNGFDLLSAGSDGKVGTSDDISN